MSARPSRRTTAAAPRNTAPAKAVALRLRRPSHGPVRAQVKEISRKIPEGIWRAGTACHPRRTGRSSARMTVNRALRELVGRGASCVWRAWAALWPKTASHAAGCQPGREIHSAGTTTAATCSVGTSATLSGRRAGCAGESISTRCASAAAACPCSWKTATSPARCPGCRAGLHATAALRIPGAQRAFDQIEHVVDAVMPPPSRPRCWRCAGAHLLLTRRLVARRADHRGALPAPATRYRLGSRPADSSRSRLAGASHCPRGDTLPNALFSLIPSGIYSLEL